ncbi:MAG: hypothetical protein QOE86_2083 [Solirubrobacteraceae bacterium]|nr:hypothetical protein [Solirubrobacteraceae bacterium]
MALDEAEDQQVNELVRRSRRVAVPMDRRRRITEAAIGAAFLAAALALALLADADTPWRVGPAVVLTLLFALSTRVLFEVGAGYSVPTQLAFVPMLLLLPTPWVPLLVAGGWLLGKLSELRDGRTHPDRLLLVLPNSWFAIGPALTLVALDAQTPEWSHWPAYVLALLAQFVFDAVASELREGFGRGIAPRVQLHVLGWVQAVDALLSPLGLLAAFASLSWDYAFLLLVPPAGLLLSYSRERASRLTSALALADAARERQELIASASHEMVTPLGILIGLTDRMAPGRRLDDERREQIHGAMRRELVQLRQLVRQFVDYTRLKTDRGLALGSGPASVGPVLEDIAFALSVAATMRVRAPDTLAVRADPDRVHQMILALAVALLRSTSGQAELTLTATAAAGRVEITVEGTGPGTLAGFEEGGAAGIGLHVTRELALIHGGDVRTDPGPNGAARYVLTLPLDDGGG